MSFNLAKGSGILHNSLQDPELSYKEVIDSLLKVINNQQKSIDLLNQRIDLIWTFLDPDRE